MEAWFPKNYLIDCVPSNPVDILMLEISAFDNEVRSIIYHDMLKVVKLPLNVFHLKIMSNLEGMYSTYIV